MNTDKIIRQSLKMLGINLSDIDVNKNPYFKMLNEELVDMREQILDKFNFQIKIIENLGILPEENFPTIEVNGYYCYPHALPTDFLHIKSTNSINHESHRIKGNVLYLPQGYNSIEYFSKDIPYEHFPSYSEDYVKYCLVSRCAPYFGKPSELFEQQAEYKKQILKNNENANNGFEYQNNDLVRR